jgi:DNA-binding phage protein
MHRQKVDDITNGESVMVEKLTRFDAATYLNTHEEMVAYLVACFEEDAGDGILIRAALNDVVQATGRMQVATNEDMERSRAN